MQLWLQPINTATIVAAQSPFQESSMSISNTPTFNLKAVIKETGIAADTLRAWERR